MQCLNNNPGKNVLVIDDDMIVCSIIKKIAENRGATVTIIRDRKDAFTELRGPNDYKLIFLDLLLPHISGWDLLTSIRNNPKTKDTEVVIVSGVSVSNEESRMKEMNLPEQYRQIHFHKLFIRSCMVIVVMGHN